MLSLSSWCLVNVAWLFLGVPWVCLQFVIVVFPDHTHYLLYNQNILTKICQKNIVHERHMILLSTDKELITIFHFNFVLIQQVHKLWFRSNQIVSCSYIVCSKSQNKLTKIIDSWSDIRLIAVICTNGQKSACLFNMVRLKSSYKANKRLSPRCPFSSL